LLAKSGQIVISKGKKELETKSVNLPTCRATPSETAKFKNLIKKIGFARQSDFWRRNLETLIEQIEAGQSLKWPLEFVQAESLQPVKPAPRQRRARKP
jgi:hypothetical protein